MITRHLDGWDIDVSEEDSPFPIHAVAIHISDDQTATAHGRDLKAALCDLARKIHVDRRELLTLYGLE